MTRVSRNKATDKLHEKPQSGEGKLGGMGREGGEKASSAVTQE